MSNHYRIAVCDDESYYQEELCNLLKAYENESGNKLELCRFSRGEDLLKDYETAV